MFSKRHYFRSNFQDETEALVRTKLSASKSSDPSVVGLALFFRARNIIGQLEEMSSTCCRFP